ncbi:MAG: hypothetical protein ABH846_02065 [Patescibacteria group bacterium]
MIESLLASLIATAHAQTPDLDEAFQPPGQAWGQIQKRFTKFDRQHKPDLPENWREMTREEKQAWSEENGLELPPRRMNRPELPEDWVDMTDVERHGWMREQMEEKLGIELPDNWQDMTREEHRDWLKENDLNPQMRGRGFFPGQKPGKGPKN